MSNLLRAVFLLTLIALAPAWAGEQPDPAIKKLTLMLDRFVNPDHAALVIAQERGFFAAENLEVELQIPSDPNDPPKLAAAGKVDLAISYQPQLLLHVNAGLPIKRIGTLVATPLNALVMLKNGSLKSIADLKGHKVGYSVSGFEETLLKAMLTRAGLKMEDITLVNVNFDITQALVSKQVDAVIGAFRNFHLSELELAKHSGRAFYPEEEGIPSYDELVLVANREKLTDNRYRLFLNAVEKATLYLLNHPEDAWKAFIARYPNLDNELNRHAWRDTLPRLARRPAALDEGGYKRFAQFLAKQGAITVVLPISNYAVQLPPLD